MNVQALSGTQIPVVKGSTNVNIRPFNHDNPQFNVYVLNLPSITGPVPSERTWSKSWPHINALTLPHPKFTESLPVDVFPYRILGEKKKVKLVSQFHYLLYSDRVYSVKLYNVFWKLKKSLLLYRVDLRKYIPIKYDTSKIWAIYSASTLYTESITYGRIQI